jgi:hypothetical protein
MSLANDTYQVAGGPTSARLRNQENRGQNCQDGEVPLWCQIP